MALPNAKRHIEDINVRASWSANSFRIDGSCNSQKNPAPCRNGSAWDCKPQNETTGLGDKLTDTSGG